MKVTVRAGPHARSWCPVRATLPIRAPTSLRLLEEATEQIIPCQWEAVDGTVTLTWIVDALAAGATRTYAVEETTTPSGVPVVNLENVGSKVSVTIAGVLFGSYNYSAAYARPFLYPVVGPYGHGITRNYPMVTDVSDETRDHPHHKSLYTGFGKVNGVDNWLEAEGHGRIVHREFSALTSGPVYGRIAAENDWVSQAGETVVTETREMLFYSTPPDSRLLDYVVTFHAGDQAVTFGDTKEGGILSLRVASSMDVNRGLGGQITNAYGGIDESETWGRPSPWCDYSGPVAGRMVGVAVFDHPDNLRYPTQWHVRNYGLMTANCFGWSYYRNDKSFDGSYTMSSHSDLTFRYRVYIHPGRAESVPSRFLDFAFPPQVTVDPS
jgi:hypothetical protein